MEVTLIIKLPDGSTRTIDLTSASINTVWNNSAMTAPPIPSQPSPPMLIGSLSLSGIIKDPSLVGTI